MCEAHSSICSIVRMFAGRGGGGQHAITIQRAVLSLQRKVDILTHLKSERFKEWVSLEPRLQSEISHWLLGPGLLIS